MNKDKKKIVDKKDEVVKADKQRLEELRKEEEALRDKHRELKEELQRLEHSIEDKQKEIVTMRNINKPVKTVREYHNGEMTETKWYADGKKVESTRKVTPEEAEEIANTLREECDRLMHRVNFIESPFRYLL